jgi:hypothetical protein
LISNSKFQIPEKVRNCIRFLEFEIWNMELIFSRPRGEKSHPSRPPVSDGHLVTFNNDGDLPATSAFYEHLIDQAAVFGDAKQVQKQIGDKTG